MTQKKVSVGRDTAAAVLDLGDDEQLVEEVTTTKRVGRQKRKPPEPEPEPQGEYIDAELVDDDEADDVPAYAASTLASRIFGESESDIDNEYCTVLVRRNPDSIGDTFLTPCGSQLHLPPLRMISLSTSEDEIEDKVRSEYGGGHYNFQIRYDGQLRTGWQSTLADDPRAVAAANAPKPEPVAAAAAAPVTDPVTAFLDGIVKQKQLKDALFGDQERAFQEQIAELKAEVAAARSQPAEPKSERLALLEMAMTATKPELQGRLLDSLFPSDEPDKRHWVAELADVVIANKDTLLGLAASFMGGLSQSPPPMQPTPGVPPSIYSPPQFPAMPPSPTTGLFAKREKPPEPDTPDGEPVSELPADAPSADDAGALDADTEELSDAAAK